MGQWVNTSIPRDEHIETPYWIPPVYLNQSRRQHMGKLSRHLQHIPWNINFKNFVAKPPLEIRHKWEIISYKESLMWLLTHVHKWVNLLWYKTHQHISRRSLAVKVFLFFYFKYINTGYKQSVTNCSTLEPCPTQINKFTICMQNNRFHINMIYTAIW